MGPIGGSLYEEAQRNIYHSCSCPADCNRLPNSGVQRLLDTRGQRGSWMPSKIFRIPLAKFLTTLFSRSPKFFTFSHQLSNFTRIRSLDAPPSAASCPGNIFSLLFWSFTYIFKENFL